MVAGRADLRCFLTNHDMPAVAALPYLDLALGKDFRHFHIVQQGTVALLMVLFLSLIHISDDEIREIDVREQDGGLPKVFKMESAEQRYFCLLYTSI